MTPYPWKSKGICMDAPRTADVALFCDFIRTRLAPDGIDTLVLLTRYRYAFARHPECRSWDPLTETDVKAILAACRECGIRLIPKMNLFGHQSERTRDSYDGLLRGHPEFDETPEVDPVFYCRSLCPTHPDILPLVCDLMDEMADAFECDAMHIGCDEVFDIGKCDRCRDKDTAVIFAGWVNALASHLKKRGVQTFMWGDRLLNGKSTGYGDWEASGNGTDRAVALVDHDIVICDWHYEKRDAYPSVDVFAEAGYSIYICPWRYRENAHRFYEYAAAHDRGHIRGLMLTTWGPSRRLIDALTTGEYPKTNEDGSVTTVAALVETYNSFFGTDKESEIIL